MFWDVRIAASGMEPEDTRIPFTPDQTEFVNTWHDWQRGYRVIASSNNSRHIQRLIGQPLSHVRIGHLPIPINGGSANDPRAVRWIELQRIPDIIIAPQGESVAVANEGRLFDSDDIDNQPIRPISTIHPPSMTIQPRDQSNANIASSPRNQSIGRGTPAFILPATRSSVAGSQNQSTSVWPTPPTRPAHPFNVRHHGGPVNSWLQNEAQRVREVASSVRRGTPELTRLQESLSMVTSTPSNDHATYTTASSPNRFSQDQAGNYGRSNAYVHPHLEVPNQRDAERLRADRQERNAIIAARQATVLGTREDVQQPDYESPINMMYDMVGRQDDRLRHESQQERYTRRGESIIHGRQQLNNHLTHLFRRSQFEIDDTGYTTDIDLAPRDLIIRLSHTLGHGHNLAGGITMDEHRSYGMRFHIVSQGPPNGNFDIVQILKPIIPLVLAMIRLLRPIAHHERYLAYERILWEAVARFLQDSEVILDLRNPVIGSYESSDMNSGVQELLDAIFLPSRRPLSTRRQFYQQLKERWIPETEHGGTVLLEGDTNRQGQPRAEASEHTPQLLSNDNNNNNNNNDNNDMSDDISVAEHFREANPRAAGETYSAYLKRILTVVRDFTNEISHQQALIQVEEFHRVRARHPFAQHEYAMRQIRLNQIAETAAAAAASPPQPSNPQAENSKQQTHLGEPDHALQASEMSIKLECSVCQEQVADIALVPCGHMVMCRWCSDKHAKADGEHEKRNGVSRCPVCRAVIKQRLRIWGLDADGGVKRRGSQRS